MTSARNVLLSEESGTSLCTSFCSSLSPTVLSVPNTILASATLENWNGRSIKRAEKPIDDITALQLENLKQFESSYATCVRQTQNPDENVDLLGHGMSKLGLRPFDGKQLSLGRGSTSFYNDLSSTTKDSCCENVVNTESLMSSQRCSSVCSSVLSFQHANLSVSKRNITCSDLAGRRKLFVTKDISTVERNVILGIWERSAIARKVRAKKLGLSDYKQQLAADSQNVIWSMGIKQYHVSAYIAYDAEHKVQGIAYARMAKTRAKSEDDVNTEICFIATHPNNVAIFDDDKPVRGAGTALVYQIVLDTLKINKKSHVYLDAKQTAVAFYEKIGFSGEKTMECTKWLRSEDMGLFLQLYKDIGIFVEKPPEDLI